MFYNFKPLECEGLLWIFHSAQLLSTDHAQAVFMNFSYA